MASKEESSFSRKQVEKKHQKPYKLIHVQGMVAHTCTWEAEASQIQTQPRQLSDFTRSVSKFKNINK